jgi:hypothetical protein
LHLDERHASPDLQRKLTETAARVKSFAVAAAIAELWIEQPVCSRTVARIAEDIGRELVAKRAAVVDDFTHHRRQAEGRDPGHELAVVFVDGGRVQLRAEGQGPGVHGERWGEDKIARLQTMKTQTHAVDPCPLVPRCFQHAILQGPESPDNSSEFVAWLERPASTETPARWQPTPLIRTCVASMEPLETYRWMVQAEAKRRHFFTARQKAFVADGSHGNWTLWERHFPDFVPILDFVHAAEYLHAAAKALESMTLGCQWVNDLWQGRSAEVIAELRASLDVRGVGEDKLDEQHELSPLQRAWTYLSNASDKLDYPRYRREGLPTTSSLIESQIKEYNVRLKGSEKFWHESNAEAMLELVSWTLREDGPTLANYFATRRTSAFRRHDPAATAA